MFNLLKGLWCSWLAFCCLHEQKMLLDYLLLLLLLCPPHSVLPSWWACLHSCTLLYGPHLSLVMVVILICYMLFILLLIASAMLLLNHSGCFVPFGVIFLWGMQLLWAFINSVLNENQFCSASVPPLLGSLLISHLKLLKSAFWKLGFIKLFSSFVNDVKISNPIILWSLLPNFSPTLSLDMLVLGSLALFPLHACTSSS